jgi:hypothetical protein
MKEKVVSSISIAKNGLFRVGFSSFCRFLMFYSLFRVFLALFLEKKKRRKKKEKKNCSF